MIETCCTKSYGDPVSRSYAYTNGKMKSVYAGRKLKEEIAAAVGREELIDLTPEEAYPEDYEGT